MAGGAVALAVAAVTAVGGCGALDGGSSEPVGSDRFDDVIAATRAARSATLHLSRVRNDFGPAGDVGLELDADLDAAGVGQVSRQVTLEGTATRVELRNDGETAWLRTDDPQVTGPLSVAGRAVTWVEVPSAELGDAVPGLPAELADAWSLLAVLRGVGATEPAGTDQVGDAPVELQRGDLDYDTAHAAASEAERAGLDRIFGRSRHGQELDDMEVVVGLDRAGRVRHLAVEGAVRAELAPRVQAAGSIEVDLDVTAVDGPVAPPERPDPAATVALDEVPAAAEAWEEL